MVVLEKERRSLKGVSIKEIMGVEGIERLKLERHRVGVKREKPERRKYGQNLGGDLV